MSRYSPSGPTPGSVCAAGSRPFPSPPQWRPPLDVPEQRPGRTVEPGRRSLLGTLAAFLLALPVLGPLLAALRPALGEAPRKGGADIPLLPLAKIPEDRLLRHRLRFVRRIGPYREVVDRIVFLRRNGNEVQALDAECTHLGCPVRLAEDGSGLACPCHGGRFDLDGRVTDGPPPRPLRRYATRMPRDPRRPVLLEFEDPA